MYNKVVLTFLMLAILGALQAQSITGKIILDKKPIGKIEVSISIKAAAPITLTSDANGKFTLPTSAKIKNSDLEVELLTSGYKKLSFRLVRNNLYIYIQELTEIYGTAKYTTGEAVPNANLVIVGTNLKTDADGNFRKLLRKKVELDELYNDNTSLNGRVLKNLRTLKESDYVYKIIITLEKNPPKTDEKPTLVEDAPPVKSKPTPPVKPETPASQTAGADKNIEVLKFETKDKVLQLVEIEIAGRLETTDDKGTIELDPPLSNSEFENLSLKIAGYNIIEQKLVDNFVTILLENSTPEQKPELEPVDEEELFSSIYKEEFVNIYDEIRTQRQFLQEHNIALREQIIKLGEKFVDIPDKTNEDAQVFLRYLEELAAQVDMNYQNYTRLIDKTVFLIDTIEQNVSVDNDTISSILEAQSRSLMEERQIHQNRYIRRYLAVFIIGIFTLGAILIIIIYGDRKIKLKNDQLKESNEALSKSKINLEHQISLVDIERQKAEKAYENIQLISRLGQKATSNLDQSKLIQNIYEDIRDLMEIDEFEVGIFDELYNVLRVSKYSTENDTGLEINHQIDNSNTILGLTFKNNHEFIVADSNKELSKELNSNSDSYSAIYFPLVIKGKSLGSLGVKKFKTNIYTDSDVDVLKAFGNYIAVAIENSNAYKIIKQNNDKITDSLLYAQKMQKIILPSEVEMTDSFSKHFVIYKPKDIVSGDFYWKTQTKTAKDDNATLLAVADCTGHGVPGAFMSILGTRLLDEIIVDEGEIRTNVILEKLDSGVQKALKQHEKNNTDGMDIVVCLFEHSSDGTLEVTYSSAKMTLYYYNHKVGNVERLKGSNRLIGTNLRVKKQEFKVHRLELEEEDTLYLCSDGLLDQNNVEREKFGTKRFVEMLTDVGAHDMARQKTIIESQLTYFQSKSYQRDDITLLGIKV